MRGVIEVIWQPNPLRPLDGVRVTRLADNDVDTVDSVVKRAGLQAVRLEAWVNSAPVKRKRWGRKRVRAGDTVVLQQAVGDPLDIALYLYEAYAIDIAVTAAVIAFVSDVVVTAALTMVANSLLGGNKSRSSAVDNTPAAYSAEGGANEARPYAPLALVLGEHRIYPDYASRPFNEFVVDETLSRLVVNSTPAYEEWDVPGFSVGLAIPPSIHPTATAPWTLITTGGYSGEVCFYGDNRPRTYQFNETFGNHLVTVDRPHSVVVSYNTETHVVLITDYESYLDVGSDTAPPVQRWRPMASTLPVLVRYGYIESFNTERLTSIFNWGLGDLDLSDVRIGTNQLDQYNGWQHDRASVPVGQPDRTVLTGYSSTGWSSSVYPGNVQTVDGGKLEQHDGVAESGWIERQASQVCRYVQLDIAGRLFKQSGGGIEALACDMEAQYMAVGSSTWVAFSFSPMHMSNGSTRAARETYAEMLTVDAFKVRVRRTTVEPVDASEVSELELSRVKFFRNADALYPAQCRTGLQIKASGQLNGRIDRFSGLVKAKHWIWDSAAAWTSGLFPGDSAAPWRWGFTTNPAWLFLFYARGGFINTSMATAYLGGAVGWLDRPDPSNGVRLFGAGLTNDRIDYATIVAWGQWCDANNLQCRLVIDEARNAGEVLDDIAAAGRASKTWAPGKLSVVWEAAGQPVVAAFGMSNILAGSFKVAYSADTSVDEFALQYTRSDDDYNADTVYAQVPGVAQVVSQKSERAVYAMPRAQAQRLVNLLAASRKYHRRTITFEAALEALAVQRGDVIHLAHDLTQWAYSGRLLTLTAAGGLIQQVTLSCEVECPVGTAAWFIWVRQPGGQYMSLECSPPTAGRTRTLTVLDDWPVADAPGVLSGQLIDDNPASAWPDSVPEDWMFLAGPVATPGKRARIIGMEPQGPDRVRITARDEYDEFFALENGMTGAPDVGSGERLVARAYNLALEAAAAGGWRLSWELDAAHGAEVTVAINSGPASQVLTQGALCVLGTEVLLPAYVPGSVLQINVLPVAAGTPVAISGDSLTVTI